MNSEERTETYRGHRIEVSAHEERTRAFAWSYVIDGDIVGRSQTNRLLPDAEAALRRALLAARVRVDEMG